VINRQCTRPAEIYGNALALLSSVENRVLQQTGDPVVKKMQESMLKNTVLLPRSNGTQK
jgi:hypothetical protein